MKPLTKRKAALQARLLDHSSAVVKMRGLSALTIDVMMCGIGRTGSLFYSLFKSKSALFETLIERELTQSVERFSRFKDGAGEEDGEITMSSRSARYADWETHVLNKYLSQEHVRNHAQGCAFPVLSVDISRLSNSARANYEAALANVVAEIQRSAGCDEPAAWAMAVQCIGAVMVARAMRSDERRSKLLAASADFVKSAAHGQARVS